MKKDRTASMQRIFSFLGADPAFTSPLFRYQRHVGWHEPFLSPLGRHLHDSRPMKKIGQFLPPNVFSALKNVLLRPFSREAPSTDLPPETKKRIDEKLHSEVRLLRRLTGLPLRSLTAEKPSKKSDQTLVKHG